MEMDLHIFVGTLLLWLSVLFIIYSSYLFEHPEIFTAFTIASLISASYAALAFSTRKDRLEKAQEENPRSIKGTLLVKGICSLPDCDKPAVGKAWQWDTWRDDKPNVYCLKHLEQAKKLGHATKLFSETELSDEENGE